MDDILDSIFRLTDSRSRSRATLVSRMWCLIAIKVTDTLELPIVDTLSAKLAMQNDNYHQFVRRKLHYISYESACLSGSIYFIKLIRALAIYQHTTIKYSLRLACSSNCVIIVADAIRQGCDDYGKGMHTAASLGYVDIVSLMHDNIYDRSNVYKHEAYASACVNGRLEVVKWFDNLYGTYIFGLTWAAYHGHLNIVAYAVDILSIDNIGNLFTMACDGNQPVIMQYLADTCNISQKIYDDGLQLALAIPRAVSIIWFINHRNYKLSDGDITWYIVDGHGSIIKELIHNNIEFNYLRAAKDAYSMDSLYIITLLLPKLSVAQINSLHVNVSFRDIRMTLNKYLEDYVDEQLLIK